VSTDIIIRQLREDDLFEADRIVRLAFGTFLGLPDPLSFMGDAAYVRPRWLADPAAAFVAEMKGELAGSSFATNWGSFGCFGPLTVRPDLWDRGIAKQLMGAMMSCFAKWGTRHAGLFTFADSQKHIGLYQKFGFWPRSMTAIMSKEVKPPRPGLRAARFSQVPENDQDRVIKECRHLTSSIYEGLDVGNEIRAVCRQNLGETLLLWDRARLKGLAVCHHGAGSEAGSGRCYVKFAAVQPGLSVERIFESLINACENLAALEGLSYIVAGINLARDRACSRMLSLGFRPDYQGVAMQKPNEPGYNRPDVYVIDDWR
jgi:GNAT superfamily N-acetyltransferase